MSNRFSRKSPTRPRRRRSFNPESIQVWVEGSLRLDDPNGGRSRKRGRPRGKLGATSPAQIRQFAALLLAGETQRTLAPKLFPNLNEEVSYGRTRSFSSRYRREILPEIETLRGHLLQEPADSFQDIFENKRGRPSGKLMLKTLKRVILAAVFSLAGQSQRTMAPKLFPDLRKDAAYTRTREFFHRHRLQIFEAMRRSKEGVIVQPDDPEATTVAVERRKSL